MARQIATGIDIGTNHVKVVVSERFDEKDKEFPKIIGTGHAESKGMRHGYIINEGDVALSIKTAIAEAERASGVKISRAFLSIGGVGIEALTGIGNVVVSRGDTEVSELDIEKAHEAARGSLQQSAIINRRILHSIPLQYRTDGREVLGNRPIGLKAMKLEAKVLFITSLEQHLHDLIAAIESVGIEVEDAMAAPLAASLVSLTKAQKMAGCVLANIGAETLSIVVYENGMPISLKVFPIGSNDITNDIALGLKVSLEEAEKIKLGAITSTNYPKKKLDEIMLARLSDIFDLIEAHLKQIGKNGLLPAGIIITGGGSGLNHIEELAKAALKIPSKVSTLMVPQGTKQMVKDASWSVAYGLTIWGFTGDGARSGGGDITSLSKKLWRAIGNSMRPLLP